MKRLYYLPLLFAMALVLGSCSLNDDDVNFHYTPLKIVSANLPDSFDYGQIYTIDVQILRPDDCTLTDAFDVRRSFTDSTNIRTVSAIGILLEKDNCAPLDQEVQDSFQFEVRYTKPYIFRFYSGNDADGNPEFFEVEVPVNGGS